METKSGFTLIEILIVVTILAILGTLTFSMFTSARERSRNGRRKADLETIRSALEMYRTDLDVYPTTVDLLEPNYIKELPKDPQTGEDPLNPDVSYRYYRYPSGTDYCLGAYLEGSEGDLSSLDCTLTSNCVLVDPIKPCNYSVENP